MPVQSSQIVVGNIHPMTWSQRMNKRIKRRCATSLRCGTSKGLKNVSHSERSEESKE